MKRPLLIPVILFLVGILASSLAGISATAEYVPIAVSAFILIVFLLIAIHKKQKLFYFLLCLFFFLLGIFRYAGSMAPGENAISGFLYNTPQEVLIHGTVTDTPEWKGASHARHLVFSLKANRLLMNEKEHPVTGTIRVNLFTPRERPRVGDTLAIGGRISLPQGRKNPAGFDYRTYLNRMGISAVLSSSKKDHYLKTGAEKGPLIFTRRLLSTARDRSDNVIRGHLSGTPRAITESVVLGLRGGITSRTGDVFTRTGTMHILAVSGLHVGIVALAIMGLLRLFRCPRNLMYFLTILGICAFAAFAGSRPSSMRAAIMGSFVLFGMSMGRKTDIVNALALSAFLITFFHPGQLFSPGFILSYMAVLSIIYVTPFTDAFLGVKPRVFGENSLAVTKRYLLRSLSVSFAVWIGMMPVIASYFRIITPSVVLANLVAVPALFVIVILGFGLLLAGFPGFLMPLAVLISGALNVIVPFFIKVMRTISQLPFSSVRVSSPDVILIAVFYMVLITAIIFFRRVKRRRALVVIFLLFAANLFLWNEISHRPPEELRVTFFATGKADASLLEFSDGSVMLIDGASGGRGTGMGAGRNILAPYLWQRGIRRIDCVLLTHADEDHIGGLLYVLENFDIGVVIDGGGVRKNELERKLYREFRKIVKSKNIHYLITKRRDVIKGFPDTDFAVLNPPEGRSYGDPNNDSIVMKAVTEKGNSVLFCADAEAKAIKDMLCFGSFLKSDLMKTPHHGAGLGDISTVKEFLNRADCPCAVITNKSAGCLNKDLMKAFREMGTRVYITGESGAVIAEETDHGFKLRGYCDGGQ